ncbi:DUF3124 domain-containing protein [Desulfocurvus sp. DL9XJH121]
MHAFRPFAPVMTRLLPLALFLALAAPGPCGAEPPALSSGQTIYVPAYSHIYHGPKNQAYLLTSTLGIHNTNFHKSIVVKSVRYYDSKGMLVSRLLAEPRTLTAMETLELIVPERDDSGGSGANFVVVWSSAEPVNPPLVEAVMIGSASGLGISFTTRGVPLAQ